VHRDINCVYLEKHLLSNYLTMLSQWQNATISYEITNKTWGYYTGDGEKLALLGLELQGLDEGLKNYV
jgi:hypothetical protein